MSQPGRIIGIDYGKVRIGVALSDPLRLFASPHSIISDKDASRSLITLKMLIENESVVKAVIGLPTDSQGQVGNQAAIVIRWARSLADVVSIPIVFWDESYTSIEASQISKSKRRTETRRHHIDDIAAATILQDYLVSATGIEHETGRTLETFSDIP